MAKCKTVVSPLLTHWRYRSLPLSHRHVGLTVGRWEIMAVKPEDPIKVPTLKRKGRQVDSLDIHWRRWRQASTSPVNTKAVNLTTFLFLCIWYRCTNPSIWCGCVYTSPLSLQWRHNECDGVSNHQHLVCSTVCSSTDHRKHQSSASLAFVRGIHRWIPHTKGQ